MCKYKKTAHFCLALNVTLGGSLGSLGEISYYHFPTRGVEFHYATSQKFGEKKRGRLSCHI